MDNVIEFIKDNKNYYKEYFKKNRLSKCKYGYTCDINQIYCYLKEIDIKKTEYYNFYKITKRYFDTKDVNIIELCCGYIPILSSLFINEAKTLTAINKKILINNYNQITTIEHNLNKSFDLSKYDLIISIRPCNVTEKILDLCFKYKKEFIIYLCPCIHKSKNKEEFDNYIDWINYLKNKTSKNINYNISFISFNELPDNCPVIIGKIKT